MSRSDNIPATSYWARKKVEFEADAEAGATSSLIRYELMTIAEAVDRPIFLMTFSTTRKVGCASIILISVLYSSVVGLLAFFSVALVATIVRLVKS